ncbi:hypothetical protein B0H21DRAFT_660436, partial [Amylocystis lapponica]
CWWCKVGGPSMLKESDEGYHALHKVYITEHQTAMGVKDKIAQHWIEKLIQEAARIKLQELGHSANSIVTQLAEWLKKQTSQPFNILLSESTHLLLRIEKYVWHVIHTTMSSINQDKFTICLQGTNIDGLNILPICAAYMMQYRNNLIGKHFKTLMQTATFHMHDLVTPAQFQLVKTIGELGAVLWISEIDDMDCYLDDLCILIDNVLNAFDTLDPAWILIKCKLHVLLHICSDICRFGPAVRFSTK